jgi:hypothetical protein
MSRDADWLQIGAKIAEKWFPITSLRLREVGLSGPERVPRKTASMPTGAVPIHPPWSFERPIVQAGGNWGVGGVGKARQMLQRRCSWKLALSCYDWARMENFHR